MGRHLGIDFLMDFGGFLEASWEGKSSQDRTRQDTTGQDRTRQNKTKTKTRQDKTLADKEREGCFCAPGGAGFTPLLGGYLPRALDPWLRRALERPIRILWPSWCLPFFHRFFHTFLDRFWLHFPSQLASKNPPKSIKNRSQDAFPS